MLIKIIIVRRKSVNPRRGQEFQIKCYLIKFIRWKSLFTAASDNRRNKNKIKMITIALKNGTKRIIVPLHCYSTTYTYVMKIAIIIVIIIITSVTQILIVFENIRSTNGRRRDIRTTFDDFEFLINAISERRLCRCSNNIFGDGSIR